MDAYMDALFLCLHVFRGQYKANAFSGNTDAVRVFPTVRNRGLRRHQSRNALLFTEKREILNFFLAAPHFARFRILCLYCIVRLKMLNFILAPATYFFYPQKMYWAF